MAPTPSGRAIVIGHKSLTAEVSEGAGQEGGDRVADGGGSSVSLPGYESREVPRAVRRVSMLETAVLLLIERSGLQDLLEDAEWTWNLPA